jgi:hypothetical protein
MKLTVLTKLYSFFFTKCSVYYLKHPSTYHHYRRLKSALSILVFLILLRCSDHHHKRGIYAGLINWFFFAIDFSNLSQVRPKVAELSPVFFVWNAVTVFIFGFGQSCPGLGYQGDALSGERVTGVCVAVAVARLADRAVWSLSLAEVPD